MRVDKKHIRVFDMGGILGLIFSSLYFILYCKKVAPLFKGHCLKCSDFIMFVIGFRESVISCNGRLWYFALQL